MIIALYIGLMRRLPHWRIEKVTRKADSVSRHDRKERRLHSGGREQSVGFVVGKIGQRYPGRYRDLFSTEALSDQSVARQNKPTKRMAIVLTTPL